MLKHIAKRVYLLYFNWRNNTDICSIHASIHASYGNKVLIDKNTIVEENVSIDDYSYVNKNSSIENCIIGKYCSISSGVYISPYEHAISEVSTHPKFESKKSLRAGQKRVTIGNDVLISLNAIILQGVTIGDGAVIGAGAVVTHDVAPYEIVGGVPARHIRYRFNKETIRRLEEIQWWNWDLETIDQKYEWLRETCVKYDRKDENA